MKCTRCGYENEDNAKFCTSCGAPLTMTAQQDTAVLLELAEAYTGSPAQARKIVEASQKDIRSVSAACVDWIRLKDQTLFQDAAQSAEGRPTLDTITDMEKTIRDLDYEERIIVLMHCLEKMSPAEIARTLHITEDQVVYYLQCAYDKNNPPQLQASPVLPKEKKRPERKKRPVKKKEPKEQNDDGPKFLKHISMQTRIIIAVIAALIVGSFLGIKSYAHDEYLRGVAYLEEKNYDQALEPLMNAKRYGGSEDAGLKLGDLYYDQEDYQKALKEYQSCSQEKQEVKDALIRTYQKLADLSIAESNYGNAAEYLESQYELDEDEHTNIRLNAVKNNGTYTAEDGNIYNVWGDPVKLYAVKNGRKLYQVELEYNDDRTLKSMKESVSDYTSRINFNQFSSSTDIEASWFLKDDNTVSYSVQTALYDEHDNPTQITVTTTSSIQKTAYTYTYDGNQIKSASLKTKAGTVTASYTYTDDKITEIKYSDNTSVTYEYDRDGQRIHETDLKENGDIIMDISYDHDDSGNVVEKIIKRNDTDSVLPFAAEQDITYTYTKAGKPSTMTVLANNAEVANGYYIENAGWIILYHTAE